MAHTKAKGTSKLGRDSVAKRLGVKIYGGMQAKAGDIIIRQRGSKFFAGENVAMGKDDTIYAQVPGVVKYYQKAVEKFSGHMSKKTFVSVIAQEK